MCGISDRPHFFPARQTGIHICLQLMRASFQKLDVFYVLFFSWTMPRTHIVCLAQLMYWLEAGD